MNIVILTGAGVSAESGLGTFRSDDGMWFQYDLEEVATPEGFARNPALVHEFYNARRVNCRNAIPNLAHMALAQLEAGISGDVMIVTQNIDDLHERAGSRNVLHIHGEIERARCTMCAHTWSAPEVMTTRSRCPRCWSGYCRPDVVWFGEEVLFLSKIEKAIRKADLFVMIGSSGQVSPASEFMALAQKSGADTLELNLESSEVAHHAKHIVLGPATETVPKWVSRLIHPPTT